MNTSLVVILQAPNKLSCTIFITGAFPCGETIIRGVSMSSSASALASNPCGTCKFISSPSKSALYGGVQLKFKRNVE